MSVERIFQDIDAVRKDVKKMIARSQLRSRMIVEDAYIVRRSRGYQR